MKILKYPGLDGNEYSCGYVIGKIDGKIALVFKQFDRAYTSITNTIEMLASIVLRTDLRGTDPAMVRIFEFYPPHMKPMRVWAEVGFKGVYLQVPEKTLLQRLVDSITNAPEDCYWTVDRPTWSQVDTALSRRLAGLHPMLM